MPTGITTQAAPTFQQQFQEVMFYLGPIAQLAFWAALAISAVWAVLIFRKLVALKAIEVGVDAVVAADAIEESAAKGESAKKAEKPPVDEFVE
ncbi:MAG: hypothetical protein HY876_04955 [Coriobacteriales bacterium]|nr:hypothetical protein [Coriobacteriales bacterium]